MGIAVAMLPARNLKQPKGEPIELKESATQFSRHFAGAVAMAHIPPVIDPTGVVQEREQFHHSGVGAGGFSKAQPIVPHPCPVSDAVNPAPVELEPVPEARDQFGR